MAAAAIAWFGLYWVTTGQYWQSTDDAYVGGNVTDLAPKVSGLIARIAVTDNQFVRAGMLLVKIDDRDYRAALAKAQAAVAGDDAALDNLAPDAPAATLADRRGAGRHRRQQRADRSGPGERGALPRPGRHQRRFGTGSADGQQQPSAGGRRRPESPGGFGCGADRSLP